VSDTTTAATTLATIALTTRRGIESEVLVGGPERGAPVVFFHGFTGHLGGEQMLGELAASGLRVHAPVWPGYSDASTETMIEDMLDFTLHGADVVDALGLGPAHGRPAPHLIGHSMGAMVAGEMAALAPYGYERVVLVAPLGLWLDDSPIPDIYSLLPFEFPPMLFSDVERGIQLLAGGGVDFDDVEAIKRFLIGNSRRLGTAGKIMFPIPNRRLSKRLYRITNPTLLVWGSDDKLVGDEYAAAWSAAIAGSTLHTIAGVGHMAPYEKPGEVAQAIARFLSPRDSTSAS
jgi:pimeloyl-ACP methyl ester carboxylesterase